MTKLICVLCLLAVSLSCFAYLPVNVDLVRFMDAQKNTRFEINYQIRNVDLKFEKIKEGYFPSILVKIEILKGEQVLKAQDFSARPGVRTELDALSKVKGFLDKISLTLANSDYSIRLTFTDQLSNESRVWKKSLQAIAKDQLISDLELSAKVRPDSTKLLEKFHRNGNLYMVEPTHVFYSSANDSLYLYYELYNLSMAGNGKFAYNVKYRISRDKKVVQEWSESGFATSAGTYIDRGINVKNLAVGTYDLTVTVTSGTASSTAETIFVMGEQKEDFISVFPDMEKEYMLLKYLVMPSKMAAWNSLTADGKRHMAQDLWLTTAKEQKMPVTDWLKLIQTRIEFANRSYTHFKAGWETDIGRIYVRRGQPLNISNRVTAFGRPKAPGTSSGDETPLEGKGSKYPGRSYQIWQYPGDIRYIFIDVEMNGNYRLIYAINDPWENSVSGWQDYIGGDVDESDLDKDPYLDDLPNFK